jgi:hypothetical protein
MNSYFEIGGHIVECSADDNTSHPSSLSMVSAAERPERGRNSAKDETSSMSITSASRSRGRSEIHKEIQRYAIDMWTIPIRNTKPWDYKSPLGAGLRNFKLMMERNIEFYEYLSET